MEAAGREKASQRKEASRTQKHIGKLHKIRDEAQKPQKRSYRDRDER